MLSANRIKQIRSLQQKKFRKHANLFIAEGSRLIREILRSTLEIESVFHTSTWTDIQLLKGKPAELITEKEMSRISGLKTPTNVLAVIKEPKNIFSFTRLNKGFSLALDDIQDPGNLGSIIRTAHWFGISTILCSHETADAYSPKVVQATMGALVNVSLFYVDLQSVLTQAYEMEIPLIGTFLNGENIYTCQLPKNGVLVMGNEGNGIQPNIERFITQRISIPSFSTSSVGAESLNVSVATAIACSELQRRAI
ncbi:MAG TPA: RNA methyltransferase [Bacteroidetes bacterium]|nr:RNA methyltransferase [Bacteroidota bacterium]